MRACVGMVSMADDIAQWLENIGLGQYAKAFADHDVHFDVFLDPTDSDLRELGVSLGDRKRFFRAIGEMNLHAGLVTRRWRYKQDWPA